MELAIKDNFRANMRTKEISIRDAGGSISISFGVSVLLLNKPQISIIEIIKDCIVEHVFLLFPKLIKTISSIYKA